MAEVHWSDLEGRELRYLDRAWRLTGDVEVLRGGELLGLRAVDASEVSRDAAWLYFGLLDPPASLNPGNLAGNFHDLERSDGGYEVVVRAGGRTYRYGLRRLEYE